jgi:hypothetical protein
MKAAVQDKQILAALKPLELATYLRSTGWLQAQTVGDRWAILDKGQ